MTVTNAQTGAPYSEHWVAGLSALAHKFATGEIELVATSTEYESGVKQIRGPVRDANPVPTGRTTETVYRFRPVEKIDNPDKS